MYKFRSNLIVFAYSFAWYSSFLLVFSFFFAFSLGAEECDNFESVPHQAKEQAKAFDYYEIYTQGRLRLYLNIGTRINLIRLATKKLLPN